jgi:hypothetical protein
MILHLIFFSQKMYGRVYGFKNRHMMLLCVTKYFLSMTHHLIKILARCYDCSN